MEEETREIARIKNMTSKQKEERKYNSRLRTLDFKEEEPVLRLEVGD